MPDTTPTLVADSQGLTFTFGGSNFEAILTNVKHKESRPMVDVTPLSAASGSKRVVQPAPLADGDEVTAEFMGTGTFTIGGYGAIACTKVGISGLNGYIQDKEITAARGEILMGTITIKVTG